MDGQDAHPTRKFSLCGTGILPVLENGAGRMPTPQENLVFVEQASCLFLRMVLFGELKPTEKLIGKSF